jgi:hypothetical protein
MQARSTCTCMQGQGTTSTATTKVSHGEFKLVRQSKRFVTGSLVGIKDIDFVERLEAETP